MEKLGYFPMRTKDFSVLLRHSPSIFSLHILNKKEKRVSMGGTNCFPLDIRSIYCPHHWVYGKTA